VLNEARQDVGDGDGDDDDEMSKKVHYKSKIMLLLYFGKNKRSQTNKG
jgi:hypothetical protein